jgi:hypothetical protein
LSGLSQNQGIFRVGHRGREVFGFKGLPQPFAIDEFSPNRKMRCGDICPQKHHQFDASGISDRTGMTTGNPQQSRQKIAALFVGHGPVDDGEEVDVTLRPQAARHCRSMQINRKKRLPKDAADGLCRCQRLVTLLFVRSHFWGSIYLMAGKRIKLFN